MCEVDVVTDDACDFVDVRLDECIVDVDLDDSWLAEVEIRVMNDDAGVWVTGLFVEDDICVVEEDCSDVFDDV